MTLKQLWFSVEKAEAWSSRGTTYKPGETTAKWDSLPEPTDSEDTARDKLRGTAYKMGWRQTVPQVRAAPPSSSPARATAPGAVIPASAGAVLDPALSPWFAAVAWWNREHGRGRWRYVDEEQGRGWWAYKDHVWEPVVEKNRRLEDEWILKRYQWGGDLDRMGYRAAAEAITSNALLEALRAPLSELWAGMRAVCRGPLPKSLPHHVGVPDGVYDMREHKLLPHHPDLGIRAVTIGRFRPDNVDEHGAALRRRFGKVFHPSTLGDYVKLVGLALSGLAQSKRALVIVKGLSGSGKGDSVNVLHNALGQKAHSAGVEWLLEGHRSDIDAIGYDLLLQDPAVLSVDEIGGSTQINVGRLLTLTGNAPWAKRRAYGTLLRGHPSFQIWATCVSAPDLRRGLGLERRIVVLPTLRALEVAEQDEDGAADPALLDAVVTMSLLAGTLVFRGGYAPPEGDPGARARLMQDADALGAWIDAHESLDTLEPAAAAAAARADLGMDKLSVKAFGSSVTTSSKWEVFHSRQGNRYRLRQPKFPVCGDCGAQIALSEFEGNMPVGSVLCDACSEKPAPL